MKKIIKVKRIAYAYGSDFYHEWYTTVLRCSACNCKWMENKYGESKYCPCCGAVLRRGSVDFG